MPNTRRANLIVAAGFFFAIILGLSWNFHDLDYFPGMVLIVSLFMILIACAVCNPWLTILPMDAMLLLASNMQVQIAANEITQDWSVGMFHGETPLRMRRLWPSDIDLPSQRVLSMNDVGALLCDELDGWPVRPRVLFVQGANPAATAVDQTAMLRGLAREKCLV